MGSVGRGLALGTSLGGSERRVEVPPTGPPGQSQLHRERGAGPQGGTGTRDSGVLCAWVPRGQGWGRAEGAVLALGVAAAARPHEGI